MTPTDRPAIPRLGRVPRSPWTDVVVAGAAAVFAVALTWSLVTPGPMVRLDVALRDFALGIPSGVWWAARILNFLGQGTPLAVVSLACALLLAWRWRSIRPVALAVAAYFAVGGVIGPIKLWTDRVAPRFGPGADGYGPPYPDPAQSVLFTRDDSVSYPSGHAVNSIVWWALIVAFLTPLVPALEKRWPRWLVRLAPPVLTTISMTLLTYHWLTDALMGMACGIVIERVLFRLPWTTIPLPGFLRRYDRGPATGTPADTGAFPPHAGG